MASALPSPSSIVCSPAPWAQLCPGGRKKGGRRAPGLATQSPGGLPGSPSPPQTLPLPLHPPPPARQLGSAGLGLARAASVAKEEGSRDLGSAADFSSQGTRVNPRLHTPQLSGFPTSGHRAAEALEARRYSHLLLPSELPLSSQGWGWLLTPPWLHRALSGDVRGRGYSYHQVAGPGGSGGGACQQGAWALSPKCAVGVPLELDRHRGTREAQLGLGRRVHGERALPRLRTWGWAGRCTCLPGMLDAAMS